MTVRVEGVDHSPFEGVKVYAFDGTTYKGYSGTSGKDGQVTFTLPQGNYRFRGDLNGTQFWSSTENACALPGCASAAITLPGGNRRVGSRLIPPQAGYTINHAELSQNAAARGNIFFHPRNL
jgi:hypothetical protein